MKALLSQGIRLLCLAATAPLLAATHPLDPLSTNEISIASATLKADARASTNWLFPVLTLMEPPKSEVLAWQAGQPFRREAFAIVLDRRANKTYEAVVDLRSRSVASFKHIPGVQPLITTVEDTEAMDLVRESPEWQAAIAKRGITNYAEVTVIGWAPGHHPIEGAAKDARLYRLLSYYKNGQTNAYGPPIEGIEAVVDLNKSQVIQVIDTGVIPVGKESTDFYDEKVRGSSRPPLKPLIVSQPEGASFVVDGNEVRWDRWRFRFTFDVREGLVLHQARYDDHGRERSVLYRGSVSEMLVPYAETDKTWHWRSAFDAGEYGLGKLAAPLEPGRTCPSHATVLDVPIADDYGEGTVLPQRIDIYESEGGTLWSHWDYWALSDGRRSRELAIGFASTIGNYDYTFHWIFRQDGVIEFVTELTGIILTKGVAATRCQICQQTPNRKGMLEPRGDERYGSLVAPNTVGANHQHFVNIRLDLDVDGAANSVKEINVEAARPGKANPHRNAFIARQKIFNREREAARDVNTASHRHWAIFNPAAPNALGHYPSYILEPATGAFPFLPADTVTRKFAGFADHHFFATRYKAEERYAAGDYPTHSPAPDNVALWSRDNESIRNQDVVIWHTLGLTHVPRPEDYPVMPAARKGFKLVPRGFFERNPALDAAPLAR